MARNELREKKLPKKLPTRYHSGLCLGCGGSGMNFKEVFLIGEVAVRCELCKGKGYLGFEY